MVSYAFAVVLLLLCWQVLILVVVDNGLVLWLEGMTESGEGMS